MAEHRPTLSPLLPDQRDALVWRLMWQLLDIAVENRHPHHRADLCVGTRFCCLQTENVQWKTDHQDCRKCLSSGHLAAMKPVAGRDMSFQEQARLHRHLLHKCFSRAVRKRLGSGCWPCEHRVLTKKIKCGDCNFIYQSSTKIS